MLMSGQTMCINRKKLCKKHQRLERDVNSWDFKHQKWEEFWQIISNWWILWRKKLFDDLYFHSIIYQTVNSRNLKGFCFFSENKSIWKGKTEGKNLSFVFEYYSFLNFYIFLFLKYEPIHRHIYTNMYLDILENTWEQTIYEDRSIISKPQLFFAVATHSHFL